jgi:prepilin-type N-terminal cleavage/methylation domain-containing protein
MKKVKGYTLVEVIVTVAVFALLVTPIVLLIQQSLKVNINAKTNLEVAEVINQAVENLVYQNVYGTGSLDINGYTVNYEIDDSFKTGTIQNIENSQIDFRMYLDATGKLTIEDLATHNTYERQISSSTFDKLRIQIRYDEATKRATYTFILNGSPIITFLSGSSTEPAKLGAEFVCDTLSHFLYIVVDGVYDLSNKLTTTMFNLWLTNVNNNIKIIATTPFIVYDNSPRHSVLTGVEKVRQIYLKIYNSNGQFIKEYTTYYTYRVK